MQAVGGRQNRTAVVSHCTHWPRLNKRVLLADGADDTTFWPSIVRRKLVLLPDHFVVLRHRVEFALRHHVHHLVAARLELVRINSGSTSAVLR
jgi:hypothetical protein